MILEPIEKQPLLPGQFTEAVWSTVASVMQGTVSTALTHFMYQTCFVLSWRKLPLRHTNCFCNPNVSWGLTNLGEGVTSASLTPAASCGILNTPRGTLILDPTCLVSCVLCPNIEPGVNPLESPTRIHLGKNYPSCQEDLRGGGSWGRIGGYVI